MKAKNNIYILGIILGMVIPSCEIDRFPYDSISNQQVLNSADGFELATFGNYASLLRWSDSDFGLSEYGSDDVSLSVTTAASYAFSYSYKHSTTSREVEIFWNTSYPLITSCNNLIISNPEGKSPEINNLIGENYYIRALVYFRMVNVFGRPYYQGRENPGVPLKLNTDVTNKPPRASVGEIYDQVVKDLLKAETLMTIDKGHCYASKFAAKALLARVYLYMQDYSNALLYANDVISSGNYTMLSTSDLAKYSSIRPEDNSETIFANKKMSVDMGLNDFPPYEYGWAEIGSLFHSVDGVGWAELFASKPFLDLIGKHPEDVRNGIISAVKQIDPKNLNPEWAYYVNNKYLFVTKDVTYDAVLKQYYYLDIDKVTKIYIDQETNTENKTLYSMNVNGTKTYVEIGPKLALLNGYPRWEPNNHGGQDGIGQLWSPIVSRLAEMYLIRAETHAKLGNDQSSLDDVNLIRKRAGLSGNALYTLSKLPAGKSVFDLVMEERRLELAFLGFRRGDLFRNGMTLYRQYPGMHTTGTSPVLEIPATDPLVVEYIPQSAIFTQPNLIQNP
jgi:hypothetical protein